jgi:hypothetical protein
MGVVAVAVAIDPPGSVEVGSGAKRVTRLDQTRLGINVGTPQASSLPRPSCE